MAYVIEWRRVPNPHTGSAEMRGLGPNPPFIYLHPQDRGVTPVARPPIASSSARWYYNYADTTKTSFRQAHISFRLHGYVSHAIYKNDRDQYRQLPAADQGAEFRGQEEANRVFNLGQATHFQPSGEARYEAFLSLDPEEDDPHTCVVDATAQTISLGFSTPSARIGMGRSVTSEAQLRNHTGEVGRIRSNSRLRFLPRQTVRTLSQRYTAIIPSEGEVKIGISVVGLGYTVADGGSAFLCVSNINFQISGGAGILGNPATFIDDNSGSGIDNNLEEHEESPDLPDGPWDEFPGWEDDD